MKMPFTVKAHFADKLTFEHFTIKRFQIERVDYKHLVQKIIEAFPFLDSRLIRLFWEGERHLKLFWEDDEGDKICLSNDREFGDALTFISDGVLKVYIQLPGISGQGHLHENITCDGCGGRVYGVRYKCLVCPDYDLCEKCKLLGLHSDHLMLVTEKPLKGSSILLKQYLSVEQIAELFVSNFEK